MSTPTRGKVGDAEDRAILDELTPSVKEALGQARSVLKNEISALLSDEKVAIDTTISSKGEGGALTPRRPSLQVIKISDNEWRCPDGRTFVRSHLAYRHLKALREQGLLPSDGDLVTASTVEGDAAAQAANASPWVAAAAAAANETAGMAPQFFVSGSVLVVFDRAVNFEALHQSDGSPASIYAAARLWIEDNPTIATPPAKPQEDYPSILPPLSSKTAASGDGVGNGAPASSPVPKPRPVGPVDTLLQGTPDVPADTLLSTHIAYWSKVRNTHQGHRLKRLLNRSKRLHQLLPPTGATA